MATEGAGGHSGDTVSEFVRSRPKKNGHSYQLEPGTPAARNDGWGPTVMTMAAGRGRGVSRAARRDTCRSDRWHGRGVRVWALAGEYDLTTADGRRHFREAMVAAAGESDKISERVKRGKLRRARRGPRHGGGRGYAHPGIAPAPPGWEPGDPREPVPRSGSRRRPRSCGRATHGCSPVTRSTCWCGS
jgi:hypothetical protein